MTKEFLKNILSIPNPSGNEGFIKECIAGWAATAGASVSYDGAGNMYLVKGSPNEHGYYVCGTAHLDSVIEGADEAVKEKRLLEIEESNGRFTATLDGKPCVIGGDDKAAIAIVLSVLATVPSFKVALFVEEELGMRGSRALDKKFFEDVSWVMGFDSPGPSGRATRTSAGTYIYSKEFGEILEKACGEHGVDDFRDEPTTDVLSIKCLTGCDCCNISNGGYACHTVAEYVVYDETNARQDLALDLYSKIPADRLWRSDAKKKQVQAEPSVWTGGKDKNSELAARWKDFLAYRNAMNSKPAGRTKPAKHSDDEICSAEFDLGLPATAVEFCREIDPSLDPTTDETGFLVCVCGSLGKVKEAYRTYQKYVRWASVPLEDLLVFDGDEYPETDKTIDV